MKLCRFQPKGNSGADATEILQGVISGETVRQISGDMLGKWEVTSRSWPIADVKLLPPVAPSKIVALGRNYADHAAEFNNVPPKEPLIFLKPPSSLLAPGDPIVLLPEVQRIDFEGELAVVIGRTCRNLKNGEDYRPYVAGYTLLNDVSARDYQALDKQWTRAKAFDTFCPLGPVLETDFDITHGTIETTLNGVRKQYAPFTAMLFPIDVIIPWVSRVMTLLPGDVIATGTPAGVGPMKAGDVVEITVPGIGTLRNPAVNPAV
ncbi:MAG TPA: fumarylacetoacetate hydrolase family protein [Candidatus Sulfotelmatobacter sp.]|jgi:2-keto-4-pentenoate hydratase/2-oxohepta-3-ene-1,7-dioic acid hydratase in catechol pathway|nr:fumarylacetoacetate hydrolase family protein [Candidatus Sulfotelmatobacter sp.]